MKRHTAAKREITSTSSVNIFVPGSRGGRFERRHSLSYRFTGLECLRRSHMHHPARYLGPQTKKTPEHRELSDGAGDERWSHETQSDMRRSDGRQSHRRRSHNSSVLMLRSNREEARSAAVCLICCVCKRALGSDSGLSGAPTGTNHLSHQQTAPVTSASPSAAAPASHGSISNSLP